MVADCLPTSDRALRRSIDRDRPREETVSRVLLAHPGRVVWGRGRDRSGVEKDQVQTNPRLLVESRLPKKLKHRRVEDGRGFQRRHVAGVWHDQEPRLGDDRLGADEAFRWRDLVV